MSEFHLSALALIKINGEQLNELSSVENINKLAEYSERLSETEIRVVSYSIQQGLKAAERGGFPLPFSAPIPRGAVSVSAKSSRHNLSHRA